MAELHGIAKGAKDQSAESHALAAWQGAIILPFEVSAMKTVCKICGEPEESHHEFDPLTQPDGCECDPLEWDVNPIPEPCPEFQGEPGKPCRVCEHDEGCHNRNE